MTRTPQQKVLLQRVIDWLSAGAPHIKINDEINLEGFDYSDFIQYDISQTTGPCKTIACIAGAAYEFYWADQLHLKPEGAEYRVIAGLAGVQLGHEAAEILGLNKYQKELLFWPFSIENSRLKFISPQYYDEFEHNYTHPLSWTQGLTSRQVAIVLQHFQDTDQINWSLVKP